MQWLYSLLTLRELRSLQWLNALSPGWYGHIQQRREERFLSWLRHHDPEAFQRVMRDDLPRSIRTTIVRCLAASSYRPLSEPLPGSAQIETDLLYIAATARPDVIKEVVALKRVKPDLHCTLLITDLSSVKALAERWYDRVVFYRDPIEFIRMIRAARAKAVILKMSGGMKNVFLPARLFFDGRLLYRPSGFIAQMDGNFTWGDWPASLAFEAEKFFTEHVDGIYHFYGPAIIDRLRRDGMRITCPAETIYPACVSELGPRQTLKRLSETDGELHLVYCSGIGERGIEPARAGEVQLWDKWRAVVEQGVHIHFYSPVIPPNDRRLIDYQQLAKDSPYFHIEQPLAYEELLATLTQYDAALHHMDFRKRANKPEALYHLTNTVWTYLQAGLPLIVSDAMPAMVELISNDGVGMIVPEDAIGTLRQLVESSDLPALQSRVQALSATEFQYPHERLWKMVFGSLETAGRFSSTSIASVPLAGDGPMIEIGETSTGS